MFQSQKCNSVKINQDKSLLSESSKPLSILIVFEQALPCHSLHDDEHFNPAFRHEQCLLHDSLHQHRIIV